MHYTFIAFLLGLLTLNASAQEQAGISLEPLVDYFPPQPFTIEPSSVYWEECAYINSFEGRLIMYVFVDQDGQKIDYRIPLLRMIDPLTADTLKYSGNSFLNEAVSYPEEVMAFLPEIEALYCQLQINKKDIDEAIPEAYFLMLSLRLGEALDVVNR